MKKLGSLVKKIIIVCIIIYAAVTFVNQQKILNTYAANSKEIETELKEAKHKNEELTKIKENVNSNEYIEETARKKLDMYYSNERVYISEE